MVVGGWISCEYVDTAKFSWPVVEELSMDSTIITKIDCRIMGSFKYN